MKIEPDAIDFGILNKNVLYEQKFTVTHTAGSDHPFWVWVAESDFFIIKEDEPDAGYGYYWPPAWWEGGTITGSKTFVVGCQTWGVELGKKYTGSISVTGDSGEIRTINLKFEVRKKEIVFNHEFATKYCGRVILGGAWAINVDVQNNSDEEFTGYVVVSDTTNFTITEPVEKHLNVGAGDSWTIIFNPIIAGPITATLDLYEAETDVHYASTILVGEGLEPSLTGDEEPPPGISEEILTALDERLSRIEADYIGIRLYLTQVASPAVDEKIQKIAELLNENLAKIVDFTENIIPFQLFSAPADASKIDPGNTKIVVHDVKTGQQVPGITFGLTPISDSENRTLLSIRGLDTGIYLVSFEDNTPMIFENLVAESLETAENCSTIKLIGDLGGTLEDTKDLKMLQFRRDEENIYQKIVEFHVLDSSFINNQLVLKIWPPLEKTDLQQGDSFSLKKPTFNDITFTLEIIDYNTSDIGDVFFEKAIRDFENNTYTIYDAEGNILRQFKIVSTETFETRDIIEVPKPPAVKMKVTM